MAGAALIWARKAALTAAKTDERQERQLNELQEERRRTQAEKERQQAERVAAWYECDDDSGADLINIRNASDVPVYEGHIFVIDPFANGDVTHVVEQKVIPPAAASICIQLKGRLPSEVRQETPDLYFIFADSAAIFWRRDPIGTLTRVDPDEIDTMIAELNARHKERPREHN